MPVLGIGRGQLEPVVAVEAFVTVLDAIDRVDSVVVPQRGHDLPHHVVQTRADPATGDHTGSHLLRLIRQRRIGPRAAISVDGFLLSPSPDRR